MLYQKCNCKVFQNDSSLVVKKRLWWNEVSYSYEIVNLWMLLGHKKVERVDTYIDNFAAFPSVVLHKRHTFVNSFQQVIKFCPAGDSNACLSGQK